MATIIRIKRSTTNGNPSTLGTGELAYSALAGVQGNGGDRLYVGSGAETSGDAANHFVVGGKYFTDMLDQVAGTLTASSAILVDSSSKIDNLKVDNLDLDGNTLSSTNANGNILITPVGTGKTVISNLYVDDTSTSLAEYIYDQIGGANTAGTGISVTNSDGGNSSTIAIDTTVTVDKTTAQTLTNKTLTSPVIATIVNTGTLTLPTSTDTLVGRATTDTLTNKTLTSPVIATIVNSGTLTLPTSTDTLVGRATTDTLTNKTLTTPTIGSAGATFSGSTSGSTVIAASATASGTITIPAATDTLVGKATTDTLTNKSISGATNTLSSIGNASLTNSSTTINGTEISLGASGTVTAAASTLTGNTLNSGVTLSSLTSVGTITSGTWNGTTIAVANGGTGTVDGSITGTGALTFTAAGSNNNVNLAPTGTGTVDANSKRITSVGDPTSAQDAATKAYVDSVASGLDVKQSVRAASTGNLTLSNTQTVDGVVLVATNRVLVKNQTTASQNGVYLVVSGGSWTRATDFDSAAEVTSGAFTFVEEGTVNENTGWTLTTDGAITVDTTSLAFSQFSSSTSVTAGDGLLLTGIDLSVNVANGIEIVSDNVQLASSVAGNGLTYASGVLAVVGTASRITANADSIDISSTYAGQNTITTLGTVTTGTWNASVIAGEYGGTGVANTSKTITLGGNLVTSGAHATTLTTTGTTGVTLPTTGTLATLAGTETFTNKTLTGAILNGTLGATTASSVAATTLTANGAVTFTSATDASNLTTAAVVLSGGLAVTKTMYVGINLTGAGPSTSELSGFNIDGGTY